jgi:hypothetical protein
MTMQDAVLPRPGPISRLTFEYNGDQIRLVTEQQVTMIIPASHPVERLENEAGFSVVLRDEREQAVYRRVIQPPIVFDVEVFDNDPNRSIRRESNPHPKGTFVVLVPAIANARTVEFFGNPLRPKGQLETPRKLADFKLAPL